VIAITAAAWFFVIIDKGAWQVGPFTTQQQCEAIRQQIQEKQNWRTDCWKYTPDK